MRPCFRECLVFYVVLVGVLASIASAAPSRTLATFRRTGPASTFPSPIRRDTLRLVAARRREFWAEWARGGAPNRLVRTVPAAIKRHPVTAETLEQMDSDRQIRHVSTATTKLAQLHNVTQKFKIKLPPLPKPPKQNTGFYYGFTANLVAASTTDRPKGKPKPPKLKDAVALTLEEIRTMRVEMEALRKELQSLKQELGGSGDGLAVAKAAEQTAEALAQLSQRELEKFYRDMGKGAEAWALQMLKEDVQDGWIEIGCNKAMRKKINPHGTTRAFMRFLKDTRGVGQVNPNDEREYPCLKATGVIEAPLEAVCLYLSQEQNMLEYNDLVENYEDLQEITPSSKVCLGQTPQILFIQPRTLVTFCKHKWLANGSQLMLNQACRHPSRLTKNNIGVFEKADEMDDNRQPMAFALRGANLIARDPDDPENKTRVTILAHGNPGRDVPTWAIKTAVHALGPLEPFRLFHNINKNVKSKLPQLQEQLEQQAQLVSERPDGRTSRPAGMAQIGYACFWPNGGGRAETPAPVMTLGPEDESPEDSHVAPLESATPTEATPKEGLAPLKEELVPPKEELAAPVGSS